MDRFDSNVELVYYVFNKYYSKYRQFEDDLIQEGLMGLWKACQCFDESRGVKFSTFAVKVIYNQMGMFMRKEAKHFVTTSLDNGVISVPDDDVTYHDLLEDKPTLSELERDAIRMLIKQAEEDGWYDIVDMKLKGCKQVQIAEKLGMSPSRVSAILRGLYAKVREKLELPEE